KGAPFWGFLKPPKIFPPGEKFFPRGKNFWGPLFPPKRGKNPRGFLKPPGFLKRGPLFGVF
ncbi:hypothetical protein EDM37_14390, partial [Staphylococcus aureus]